MPNFPIAGPSNEGSVPKILTLFDFSAEALGQLRTWLEQNPPAVSIQSIIGFTNFTFQPADTIDTSESTSSATYTDLATVGPELTALPDGQYAVFFGTQIIPGAGAVGICSVSANGAAASDTDSVAVADTAGNVSTSRVVLKTLHNSGSNSVVMKYRSTGGTATAFSHRWMIVVKFAN